MPTYEYKVKIEAENEVQAKAAMQAMVDLKKSLSHADLLLLAKTAKEKPHLLQTAKKFL